jgi:hypothetical protein
MAASYFPMLVAMAAPASPAAYLREDGPQPSAVETSLEVLSDQPGLECGEKKGCSDSTKDTPQHQYLHKTNPHSKENKNVTPCFVRMPFQ